MPPSLGSDESTEMCGQVKGDTKGSIGSMKFNVSLNPPRVLWGGHQFKLHKGQGYLCQALACHPSLWRLGE